MASIEFAAGVADDFERILDHLPEHGVAVAGSRVADIVAAIDALERNPRLGRPAGSFDRKLVIGRKSRGYLALYRYVEAIDTVFVLAVRGQSEAGYIER